MKKLLFFLLILFLAGNLFAQKKSHQEFLESIEKDNLKSMAAGCEIGSTVTEISLNNVRTYVFTTGLLWTSRDGTESGYEIPKGSGKTSIYSGGIWIGGTDLSGQLKLSAIRFAGGRNYWPGPLITEGDDQGTTNLDVCYEYDKHFETTRYQVEAFREWYKTPAEELGYEFKGYTIPQNILDWPAHADASAGYDFYLAPFWDNNEDGLYNTADGDYPFYDLDGILPCGTSRDLRKASLYGDANVWWVYNDRGNIHVNPSGEAIGMEIRAQAFQFSTNDAINDMSFYNFSLINRSTYTLIETYFGLYVDGDLGYPWDDYVGCEVSKGVGYVYNGEEVDGDGGTNTYGANPPAIGFDFFEGPYQDPNGLDDCSSYDEKRNLICNECILNGNINGLNFGDGIVDNERWGMRRFVFWTAGGGPISGPGSAAEYYNYLRGYWKDNVRMRYGGAGHPAAGATGPETDFLMPRDSDPCGWGQGGIPMPVWTEVTSGHESSDRWMVQSSGPFVLDPGAINDITIGAVWARSYEGGLFASVDKMLKNDEKAQRLFESCFRIIDGPNAPELTIIEQENKLIFNIWNKPNSNNYMENYREKDQYIVCPENDPECDKEYRFQGYQIWQLKDHISTLQDAINNNPDEARLVFQCDIRDGIGQIVNHEWDQKLQSNTPKLEVEGADQGIEHSFVIDEDLFSKGSEGLVNFKDYYYVAIAYAHNNYQTYNQNDADSWSGQKQPYKAGRKGSGGPIKIYRVTPHNPNLYNPLQSGYGDSPEITQIEGHGSGNNIIDLTEESMDSIMSGPPWKVNNVGYLSGRGPIDVKVIDPINVVSDNYILKFDSVDYYKGSLMNGKIVDADWFIYNSKGDTVFSESMISRNYDQLIPEWGLSINITQEQIPYQLGAVNNGFLEATMEFEDPAVPWLKFVKDDDHITRSNNGGSPKNWIRAGYASGDYSGDTEAVYEVVLDGKWAPFKQAFIGTNGVSYEKARAAIDTRYQRLASVDVYFTPDRDLWTRSPVIETTDDEGLSIGNVEKFYLRESQSVDKWGVSAEKGVGPDSINIDAASYISETGMGWFPGYAIDVVTGERLNIVYGESSWLTGDNGADMMWNPSTREGSKIYEAKDGIGVDPLEVFFGGKHFIYIMGHNLNKAPSTDLNYFPAYDEGRYFMNNIRSTRRPGLKELFKNAMWCAIPILNPDVFDEDDIKDDPYGFVKNEMKIRLRVTEEYRVDVWDLADPDSSSLNSNKPLYTFNTHEISTLRGTTIRGQWAMGKINVVPNPYYGRSGYTNPDYQNGVKIINIPGHCIVSIYSVAGNLVRRIIKDDWSTAFIHWDLKNDYGTPVASGVYIIHIEMPGIGEKTLKWMGSIR